MELRNMIGELCPRAITDFVVVLAGNVCVD